MPISSLIADLTQIASFAKQGGCTVKSLSLETGLGERTFRALLVKGTKTRRERPLKFADKKTLELLADALSAACRKKIVFSDLALVTLDRANTLQKFQKIGWKKGDILRLAETVSKKDDEPSTTDMLRSALEDVHSALLVSHQVWRQFASKLECSPEELLPAREPHKIRQLSSELVTSLIPNWIHHAIKYQVASGGFVVSFRASSMPTWKVTQPWSTAQLLTGMVAWPETARFHTKKLAKIVRYYHATRLSHAESLTRKAEHGWGLFENHPWAGTEQTAWVIVSQATWLRHFPKLAQQDRLTLEQLIQEIRFLVSRQYRSPVSQDDGGFCPTTVVSSANVRTYSTITALWAINEVTRLCDNDHPFRSQIWETVEATIKWILRAPNKNGGFDPNPVWIKNKRVPSHTSYPGLTAQVIWTLLRMKDTFPQCHEIPGFTRILRHLVDQFVEHGLHRFPAWSFLHSEADRAIDHNDQFLENDYVQLEGSTYFWLPWSAALVGVLIGNPSLLHPRWHLSLSILHDHLVLKIHDVLSSDLQKADAVKTLNSCMIGEILFGVSLLLKAKTKRRFPTEVLETVYQQHPVRAELVLQGFARGKPITPDLLASDQNGHISDQNHIGGVQAVFDLARKSKVAKLSHVLDVGCGIGGSARILAHHFGCKVTGIELTKSRFDDAILLTERVGLQQQVDYVHGDYLAFALPTEAYDVVWGQSSWIHFDDPHLAIAKAATLLKKGGRLALDEVVLRWIPKEKKILGKLAELENYWNGTLSTENVWKSACKEAKLSVTTIEYLTPTLKEDLLKLRNTYTAMPPEKLNPVELQSVELALALIEMDLLGLMRLVAEKKPSTRALTPD